MFPVDHQNENYFYFERGRDRVRRDGGTGRQEDRETGRQGDRETDRQTGRQGDREKGSSRKKESILPSSLKQFARSHSPTLYLVT